ncbi:MAG: toxic anion resistance protein, partial [Pseudomonadota bacterium]
MSEDILVFADPEEVKKELAMTPPESVQAETGADPELEKQADALVEKILAMDPASDAATNAKNAIENMGMDLQEQASNRSAMLQEPIRKLTARADDGGEVANALVDLKLQVEELDPGKVDLEPGWFARLLGMIPGV